MIKKMVFKVALLVGIMLMVPYYLIGGGGLPDFLKGLIPSGKGGDQPGMNVSNAVTSEDVKLYKWVDERGVTHFSDTDPMSVQVEEKTLKANTNIMKAVRPAGEEVEDSPGGSVITLGGGDKDKKDADLKLENPYSPDAVQKLVKDAQNVAKMMEQRNQELGKITGDAPKQ